MSYDGLGGGRGGGSSAVITVEASYVGRIIGRGGNTIRSLEQDSNARIKISKDEDEEGLKSVEISGSDSEVSRARDLIQQCLDGGYDGGRQGGGGFNDGGRRRGGGGGGRYGGRRDDEGGWGRSDRDRDGGDSWGRRDDRGGRGGRGFGGEGRGFGGEGGDSETIYVESGEVGKIIGRGGSRIQEMEKDSGCRIKVSKNGDHNGQSSVELFGDKYAISEAKRLIHRAGVEIIDGGSGRGW